MGRGEGGRVRWVVVGASGMLGRAVVARIAPRAGGSTSVTALSRADLDVTDEQACEVAVRGSDVVVNCAAWTAVDAAETNEAAAFEVNARGAANVARACAGAGSRLVHVSTDYVFDGRSTRPYETGHPVRPISAYGRTKVAGEWAVAAASAEHLVVRTSWLYGARGEGFPQTVARVVAEQGGIDMVDDQLGQPTWAVDVADLLVRLVQADVPGGIYHATAGGQGTWFDFATAVLADTGSLDRVRATSAQMLARPAARPAYSVLSHAGLEAAGVEPIGDWRERWAFAGSTFLEPQRRPARRGTQTP